MTSLCETVNNSIQVCSPSENPSPHRWPWWVKSIEHGWYQAQSFCFDSLRQEPKRLLLVGGCRQQAMAEYLAFAFPNTEITLVDPDAQMVRLAKEAICCRFQFIHSALETLPFPDLSMDVVIAHQLLDYVEDWPKAMAQLARVTKTHLIMSVALPKRRKLADWLPQTSAWMRQNGLNQVAPLDWNRLLTEIIRYGKVKKFFEPFPWRMVAIEMQPIREERLILT